MAYRNKTYVAFDADSDMAYYRSMQMWQQNDNTDFDFHNAHDLNKLLKDSSEETIKRKLKERLQNSKTFVLLVGEKTKHLFKFVRWEIEQALGLDLSIIVANINGLREMDSNLCPAIVKEELAVHVSFKARILQYALENWPASHVQHRSKGEAGPYYYKASKYQEFGL